MAGRRKLKPRKESGAPRVRVVVKGSACYPSTRGAWYIGSVAAPAEELQNPSTIESDSEDPPATLAEPPEYVYHLNQVAAVSAKHIVFVRRKFVSRSGYELITYPYEACDRIRYFDERPALTIVTGVILIVFVAAVSGLLVVAWNHLDSGTRVPIGALGVAGLYGVRMAFGARRHRLVLEFKDGNTLTWTSRSGQYKSKKASAMRIVDLARSRGILETLKRSTRDA